MSLNRSNERIKLKPVRLDVNGKDRIGLGVLHERGCLIINPPQYKNESPEERVETSVSKQFKKQQDSLFPQTAVKLIIRRGTGERDGGGKGPELRVTTAHTPVEEVDWEEDLSGAHPLGDWVLVGCS